MKKIGRVLAGMLALAMIIVLSACSHKTDDTKVNVTLDQFKQSGKFWTQEQINDVMNQKQVGASADDAIVPLVFDKNNKLYNRKALRALIADAKQYTQYYTNLPTYQKLTHQTTAVPTNAQNMNGVWLFDAFQETYGNGSDAWK